MSKFSKSVEELMSMFKKFPTVGEKSARRFVYFLMKQPDEEVKKLLNAIAAIKKNVKFCSKCNNLDENDPCDICAGTKRDSSVICVVETSVDLIAIERTKKYHGKYFVLHGVLSPYEGVTPNDLKIPKLLNSIKEGGVKEVILATNARALGEATANYIKDQLSGMDVCVSRIAYGISVGSELEYADSLSLGKSLEGRKNY